MNITSMLLSDAYKQVHDRQYSRGLTKLVSYWTPRKAMSKKYDRMVFFGLQAFIQDYLIDDFNIQDDVLYVFADNNKYTYKL